MGHRDSGFDNRPFAEAAAELRRDLKRQRRQARRQEPDAGAPPAGEPPPAAPPSRPGDPPPDSDRRSFEQQMAGVRPLPRDNYVPARRTSPPSRPAPDPDAEALAELADLVQGRGTFDIADTDEYIEGIGRGLDRRLLRRLRRGTFALQDHLDLHGKTRAEAREAVQQFVLRSRRRGHRCVLIVHGRGLNSRDQIPVLKEGIRIWLSRGSIARSVLAFCTARPVDGGAGAVYVLLRK
jgi:DNA-nicking Smr family endonuclease